MKFFKAPLFVFLAGIAALLLIQALDHSNDETIAALMQHKVVDREKAKAAAIEAKYAILTAAKDKEIAALKAQRAAKAAEATKWRADSEAKQAKIKDLEGCNLQLDGCQQYVVDLDVSHTEELEAIEGAYIERVELGNAEIREWKAKDAAMTKQLGSMARDLVLAQMKANRLLIIGPQVGYNPLTKQFYVGFGATLKVFSFGLR